MHFCGGGIHFDGEASSSLVFYWDGVLSHLLFLHRDCISYISVCLSFSAADK